MTFLEKCVFSMANNFEHELNIDGILLEIAVHAFVVQDKV
jgi:hypothetical protein